MESRAIATLCYMMLLAVTAWAGEVTLAWDASLTPEVTGYKIYVGSASGVYERNIDAGNVTTFKVQNLADGTWYFAATAYSPDAESEYSNEVSTTIAPLEFKITSLSVSMRWFGVVLLCTTSTNASAILRYTDIETGERQTVIATPDVSKTQHRAVLYLPMGNARYYRYEWTVTDGVNTAILGGTFQVR